MEPLQTPLSECLSSQSPAVWKGFLAQLRRTIAAAVIRTARQFGTVSPDLTDDLIQDTYVRLCARDYGAFRELRSSEPGAIYGLAQAAAVTVTLDHFRAAMRQKRGGDRKVVALDDSPLAQVADQAQESRLEHALIVQEIDRRLPELAAEGCLDRDRRIFWLYYRHGFTAKDIAGIPSLGLSPKGVESAIHRLTDGLKKLFSARKLNSERERRLE
ncbi:MAG TPA: sigma-70 family RNA polymerase sigma factor [Bryobacteraceae bacterium]|nr:sigma-70 family RNA polymerase sigma factor [Bryobacteraceae bacterium]